MSAGSITEISAAIIIIAGLIIEYADALIPGSAAKSRAAALIMIITTGFNQSANGLMCSKAVIISTATIVIIFLTCIIK